MILEAASNERQSCRERMCRRHGFRRSGQVVPQPAHLQWTTVTCPRTIVSFLGEVF
jgi:hypothetical protein